MKSKQKSIGYGILVLAIIGIIFISGCIKSPETKQFAESLPQINENLGIALGNIHTDFYNYDLEYKWSRLMNYLTITESMINEMKIYEDKIKNEMSYIENTTIQFQQSKQNVDINQLSEEEKNTLNEIETKITDYQTNKDKINSCLNAMQTYREFIDIGRLKLIKLEEFYTKLNSINEEIESGYYDDALSDIDDLKQIVVDIKNLVLRQSELGILTYDEKVISSWGIYLESLDELKKYVNYLKAGDYESADSQYTIYSQKYTEAVKASESENINLINNQIDAWYQNNIGVCVDIFVQYS